MDSDEDLTTKARVLELHTARGKSAALSTSTECLSQPPTAQLNKLQPIFIGDLKPGKLHSGFALYGTLCADAYKSPQAVHTVLEDCAGRALLLSFYNVAISSTSSSCIKQRFPIGMKVVVKEPLLKREKGGVLVLRIDNLINFERVLVLHDLDGNFLAQETVDPLTLKLEGNKFFVNKDWLAAAEAYTRCISSVNVPSDNNLVSSAYSNRAEAFLRIGNFEQALADANNAIKVDSSNVKSHSRKARALHGLHEYDFALSCFKKVGADNNNMKKLGGGEMNNIVQQMETSVKQSKSGKYDIGNFLSGGRIRDKAPPCADYIGTITIKKSGISGRGLFVTEDVKAGDLLLVTNALAAAYGESMGNQNVLQDDLVTKTMAALVISRRAVQQVNALLSSSSSKIPSLDLFRPNSKWYPELFDAGNNEPRLHLDNIRKLVKEYSFGQFLTHNLEGKDSADSIMNSTSCGLWLLPGLINHSCLPNASRLEVGKALFIHAARDIMAGEEITIPYFDALVPLHIRQEMTTKWDFTCQCKRCYSERGTAKLLKKINDQYNILYERAFKEINAAAEAGKEIPGMLPNCANFAQLAVKVQAELAYIGSTGCWLQSSYGPAFLAGFSSLEFFEDFITKIPTNEDMVESFQETVPGHWRTLILRSGELMKLREYVDKESWEEGMLKTAKEVVYGLCKRMFGHQKPEVYDALVLEASKLRPF